MPPKSLLPVFCLSSQNWFNELWTNKQHLMDRLAKQDFDVLYINKGCTPILNYLVTNYVKSQVFLGSGIIRVNPHLFIAESPELPLFGLFPTSLNYERFAFKLQRIRHLFFKAHAEGKLPIVWAYHPGYGHYLEFLPKPYFLIYDCVDDYASFPSAAGNTKREEWIREGELKLLKAAHLVTTTAPALQESKSLVSPHCHYVHNVGDFDHFNLASQHREIPDRLFGITGPKIGFFGAISSYKLDFDLVASVAKAHPEWAICLIGPVGGHDGAQSLAHLKRCPNVHFIGHVNYDELPQFLSAMDVLMIPYLRSTHTEHVFPIKFFECLATGKPVVVTPLPAYEAFSHVVYKADTADSFSTAIYDALSRDTDDAKAARLELAKKHDWDSRLSHIKRLINQRITEEFGSDYSDIF
jgi:glycosyltransferase involved in cell wall biosynthesis